MKRLLPAFWCAAVLVCSGCAAARAGIARTRNSVWAKSPVRYHFVPATATSVTMTISNIAPTTPCGTRRGGENVGSGWAGSTNRP